VDSDSNVLALVLFLAFSFGVYYMHSQQDVVTYQCPGAIICKKDTFNKLKDLGYLEVDIKLCEVKTMTNSDFYTIRQLQKEVYSR
jgi:hypothetical protein